MTRIRSGHPIRVTPKEVQSYGKQMVNLAYARRDQSLLEVGAYLRDFPEHAAADPARVTDALRSLTEALRHATEHP